MYCIAIAAEKNAMGPSVICPHFPTICLKAGAKCKK